MLGCFPAAVGVAAYREDLSRNLVSIDMDARGIDVWSIDLDISGERFGELERILDPEETERARRFSGAENRRRWTVARGALRTILARYSGTRPAKVRLFYGENGKPGLEYPPYQPRLHFNLAHSGAVGLVGVTSIGPLGIDVEQVRDLRDRDTVIDGHFSPAERKAIRDLPGDQRTTAFFNCWTRKEAYIKALGLGLAVPLDSFDVSVEPGKAAELLSVKGRTESARTWSLFHLDPRPGYIGTLAIQSSVRCKIRHYQF